MSILQNREHLNELSGRNVAARIRRLIDTTNTVEDHQRQICQVAKQYGHLLLIVPY